MLEGMLRSALILLRTPPFSRSQKIPRTNANGSGLRVLLTGRVDSKNWCMAHLVPLTRASNISELLLVIDGNVGDAPKIRRLKVPNAIGWFKPRAIARSIWAVVVAIREKPDIIMAYSLFPPGLFSLLAARWTSAVAIVQLAGGPPEVESGGYLTDDPFVPQFLVRRLAPLCRRLCSQFDAVVVRGKKGKEYVHKNVQPPRIEIISASVDPTRFQANDQPRSVDIVFIGRIVSIKQPDHVCEVVKRVAAKRKGLRVVIAGNGPLLDDMKCRASQMGLQEVMQFAGHVEEVEKLLTRSRVFLLTSRSEGLSIAMAEAMMAGAVPVVANVGDLSELVVNGMTGWLIQPGDFDAYAARISELLEHREIWSKLSANARLAALHNNGVAAITRRWEDCFETIVKTSNLKSADRAKFSTTPIIP